MIFTDEYRLSAKPGDGWTGEIEKGVGGNTRARSRIEKLLIKLQESEEAVKASEDWLGLMNSKQLITPFRRFYGRLPAKNI